VSFNRHLGICIHLPGVRQHQSPFLSDWRWSVLFGRREEIDRRLFLGAEERSVFFVTRMASSTDLFFPEIGRIDDWIVPETPMVPAQAKSARKATLEGGQLLMTLLTESNFRRADTRRRRQTDAATASESTKQRGEMNFEIQFRMAMTSDTMGRWTGLGIRRLRRPCRSTGWFIHGR